MGKRRPSSISARQKLVSPGAARIGTCDEIPLLAPACSLVANPFPGSGAGWHSRVCLGSWMLRSVAPRLDVTNVTVVTLSQGGNVAVVRHHDLGRYEKADLPIAGEESAPELIAAIG